MKLSGTGANLLLLMLAVLAGGDWVRADEAPDYRPSKGEAMLLPKFCWSQMAGVKGPEYQIPRKTCGDAMNHYCIGLIDLNRANKAFGDRNKKRVLLGAAKDNTEYTLRGMTGYPHCPIRKHAETTLEVVDAQLRALKR